jgi:AcrR family transcriptional regulator
MQRKLRARSTAAKLVRKNAIIAAAETLLRQSGYDAMTMQAVAEEVGLAKGTLYLYFPSREILIFDVYGRLFDHWIDRFASHVSEVTGVQEFCQDFYRYYADDRLFLDLTGFAMGLIELPLDRETYIKGKRAMASRVKKLAGTAYQRLGMNPISAQKFIWGLLTVASGAIQLTMRSSTADKNLPKDVIAFIGSASFETVFLNAAVPLCAGMMQDDK